MNAKSAKRRVIWLLVAGCALLAAVLLALPFVVPMAVDGIVKRQSRKYGLVVESRTSFGYCWRNGPGVVARLRLCVPGTPWSVDARFAASLCEWMARLRLPETAVDPQDPLVGKLLEAYPANGVSNVTVCGSVALDAVVRRTFSMPVPVWNVKVPLRNLCLRAIANDKEISVDGVSADLGVSGIARHYDVAPMCVKVRSVVGSGLSLANLTAMLRVSERSVVVSEATAESCGGKLSVYSLFLDPKRLNAGFTIFVDDIDAGQVLAHLKGFEGEATGRLHGKVRAFVREGGKGLRLGDAFLYSTPGQTGRLCMRNSEVVEGNLEMVGVDEATRLNLSRALEALDYSVLRFDLTRHQGEGIGLAIQLRGSATRGNLVVPVDLTINLNGDFEQLINTGLGFSSKMKGNK